LQLLPTGPKFTYIKSINQVFGDRVRGFRDSLGYSQATLAERSGLHRTFISDIERGARNSSLKTLDKLARALNVRPGDLLGEPVPEKSPREAVSMRKTR
jgi:transcriptional regulator with XRE-family HTH domain